MPKSFVAIGSYGGFAGARKTYFFFPNGQRFVRESSSSLSSYVSSNEIERFSPTEFQQMEDELNSMNFLKLEQNKEGNMTYFIQYQKKKKGNIVKWSNMETVPESLSSYYSTYTKNINEAAIN